MLSDPQFDEWSRKLSLPPKTVALIQEIRHSPPSSAVQGAAHNVHGNYPSPMMGMTNPFESHTIELRRLKKFEFEPGVLEVWAQARPIRLRYTGPSGKRINKRHWPDAFVIRKESAGWEEQKTEEELLRKKDQRPNLYQRDENGGSPQQAMSTHASSAFTTTSTPQLLSPLTSIVTLNGWMIIFAASNRLPAKASPLSNRSFFSTPP